MSTMARDFHQETGVSIDTTGGTISSFITDYATAVKPYRVLGWKIHALTSAKANRGALYYGSVTAAGAAGTVVGSVAAGIALMSSDVPVRDPANVWIKGDGGTAANVVIDIYVLKELA
jgi:hypothetical protein